MSETIKLRKGLNIKLKGSAKKELETLSVPKTIALKPTDFQGLTPKLKVKAESATERGKAPLLTLKEKESRPLALV